MNELLPLIYFLAPVLTLIAGPYRVAACKFRSFGGIGQGLLTWIGIGLAFPAFTAYFPRPDSWWMAWAALAVWAYVQMMVKWCSTAPPLDPASSHCWFGKAEPFFAFALIYAANGACGPGGALFFLAGYACSTAQWLLRRLETWTPRDTERLHASSTGKAVGFLSRGFAAQPVPQPAPGQVVYYVPPQSGIVRGFTRYLISHMIFSFLTGVIGFNVIGIPLAIVLWFMGWKVGLPGQVKEHVRSYIARAKEAISDEKDEVMEKLRVKTEAMEEKLRQQKQRFGERFSHGRPRS